MSKRPAVTDAHEDGSTTKQKIIWMDQRNHVLKRADMYIGSIDVRKSIEHVIQFLDEKYVSTRVEVTCSRALVKFLDEAIVNSIDNQRRDLAQKYIKVKILKNGEFTVTNDGSTVPIEKHESSELWKPTIVFSQFLSGTNFDDEETRFTGGRNGVGIKATNTWSTIFEVSLQNAADKKKFNQVFEDNMSKVGKAVVKSHSAKTSFTTVRWMPDYAKLGMPEVLQEGLDANVIKLLESRVYDICACVRPAVSVWLNDVKIGIKNLQQYAKVLQVEGNSANDTVVGANGDLLFQVCITAKAEESESQAVGFVNGVKCSVGSHMDMIHRKAAEILLTKARSKSKKPELALKPQFLKNELTIVTSLLIPNPRFTSQSKDVLDTPVKAFGFTWELGQSFRAALERSPLVDRIIGMARDEENKQLAKSTKTTNRTVPRIHKYDPATGLFKKKECTLILTEGDSAKSLAIAGLGVIGREQFGVFPLRGKFMNVSKFTPKRMMENAEVSNLMAILGLEFNKVYDEASLQLLPYRRMVIFSDQDIDGSHIAGLLVNFIHTNHRSILKHWPDFIERFATPIVRLTSGPEKLGFFSIQEYKQWKQANPNSNPRIKYYKGLGTSTSKDAKDYFTNWKDHVTKVMYTGEACDSAVKTFFDEKVSNERKEFLSEKYAADSYIDYSNEATTITDFLCKEMAHFSNSDNIRSIPSAIDGLKPVQRKTLHTFTSKNQVSEIKVAQAGAMVAEFTSYHHGETSVMEAIVGLAQDHVGTNNVAILRPEGQFGSRQNKASEHAAPRYIYTCLDTIARKIYRSEDDAVLDYMEDDGKSIEPQYFVPVIPMALVNGQNGIGTGWSTQTPNFSPMDVLERCIKLATTAAVGGGAPRGDDTIVQSASNAMVQLTGERTVQSTDEHTVQPMGGAAMEMPVEMPVDGDPVRSTAGVTAGGTAGVTAGVTAGAPVGEAYMTPWYANFTGSIRYSGDGAFQCDGAFTRDDVGKRIDVHELPIGVWTEDFLKYVRDKLTGSSAKEAESSPERFVKSVCNNGTDTKVSILLQCFFLPATDAIEKLLKLSTKLSVNNMHLFDKDYKLKKYSPQEIIEEHAEVRLATYAKRRSYLIRQAQHELSVATNKKRFISEIISDQLVVKNLSVSDLNQQLETRGYDKMSQGGGNAQAVGYSYLLRMGIPSMTTDKVMELEHELLARANDLTRAESSTPRGMWRMDLSELEAALVTYFEDKKKMVEYESVSPREKPKRK